MSQTTIADVFRDYATAGDPGSGAHQPILADIRDTLGARQNLRVLTRTALKAVDTTADLIVILCESGRESQWVFQAGDYSTEVAADATERSYIAADAVSSSSGAWVNLATALQLAASAVSFDNATASLPGAPTTVQAALEEIADLSDDQAISFKAYLGTAMTGLAVSTEHVITFDSEQWDVGSYYDHTNGRWTPPSGRKIRLFARALETAGTEDGATRELRIRKNGSLLASDAKTNAGTGNQSTNVTVSDIPNGTDYYDVAYFASGSSNRSLAGGASNVYTVFEGEVF